MFRHFLGVFLLIYRIFRDFFTIYVKYQEVMRIPNRYLALRKLVIIIMHFVKYIPLGAALPTVQGNHTTPGTPPNYG